VAALRDFDTESAKRGDSSRAASNGKPRVLIVDESRLLSEDIRDALQKNGVHVLGIATDADAVVAALSGGIADAVIFCMRTQTAGVPPPSSVQPKLRAPDPQAVFAPGLTQRERQVLRLLAAGLSNKDVAKKLAIRSNTVRTHVQNLLAKLRVHTRLEAVTLAIRGGLVDSDESATIHIADPQ
jgi:DNA-binding NarL/FixJ family response regulator